MTGLTKPGFRKFANILTLIRVLLFIPIIISLEQEHIYATWFLLVFGALTDLLDGHFARLSKTSSVWGARLDPLADKLIIIPPLLWLCQNEVIPFWALNIIIAREIVVTALRANDQKGRPASYLGKIKTISQFVCILILFFPFNFLSDTFRISLVRISLVSFWISFSLAISSALSYIKNMVRVHLD